MPGKTLSILFFGDIVGKPGRKALAAVLPGIKKELQPDLVIANAENIAHGIGITSKTLNECRQAGVDFFTSGNHAFKKPDVLNIFADPDAPLIRPANFLEQESGAGFRAITIGKMSLLVVNLNGQVFIEEKFSSPFAAIDQILAQRHDTELAGVFVDLHAEATSEKVAFGWHVDGRVSAVIGTHTHIPTADEKILPKGTAYITDAGMVGLKESVIGVDKDIILNNFTNTETTAHDIPDYGACVVNAVLVTIDPATRKATDIRRIHREISI
ncbi:MAG: TIGR00282 family metallophosphoesterase [Patescibacteria group bacterium]